MHPPHVLSLDPERSHDLGLVHAATGQEADGVGYGHGPIPESSSLCWKILHHTREQCRHSRISPQDVRILDLARSLHREQCFMA